MNDDSTRTELIAIPIVVVLFLIGIVLFVAADAGVWAWVLVGLAGLVALVAAAAWFAKRNPHPAARTPAPAVGAVPPSAPSDGPFRVLVIADESCVEPSFAETLTGHAGGRRLEALVIAPAIGSRLSRWTGDESQFSDARRHLDETVAALASAGITARGEQGADDPLQAADDGLRAFPAQEIVFVTRPGTSSDWVERGVIEAAQARYDIPVVHVELATA